MTTAFVLSGGGSLGAVHVGMLQTFADRGVAPDLLVGASAGARPSAAAPHPQRFLSLHSHAAATASADCHGSHAA